MNLTLEEGYPHEALPARLDDFDPPRITVYSYRSRSGYRPSVKLHLYRPTDREHSNLDDELRLTADEARALAAQLLTVATEIDVT